MDYLRTVSEVFRIFSCIQPLLERLFIHTGTYSVLDLCSGAGGSWPQLVRSLKADGILCAVKLSDLYPPPDWAKQDLAEIDYNRSPIDVNDIPSDAPTILTLFNSFHHLNPAAAEQFLSTVMASRRSIGIFEITERTWSSAIMVLCSPVLVFISTPLIRPFSFRRLLYTYALPLVPLLATLDGLLSVANSHTEAELRSIARRLESSRYHWIVVRKRTRWFLPSVLCLVGLPQD